MSIIRPASVQSILMFDSLSLQTPIKRCGVITLNPSKMKKNTFNVAFIIRRNQVNKDGKCAIMVRITVNGDYERVNSTLSIEPDLWDSTVTKAIGRTTKILAFNKRIEEIRYTIQNHYYEPAKHAGICDSRNGEECLHGCNRKRRIPHGSL